MGTTILVVPRLPFGVAGGLMDASPFAKPGILVHARSYGEVVLMFRLIFWIVMLASAVVAAIMVEQGFACDWAKFSGGRYSENGKGRACEIASGSTTPVATNLEAETLARMKEFESGLRELNLDSATSERLIQQGLEALLKSYCLQSQMRAREP